MVVLVVFRSLILVVVVLVVVRGRGDMVVLVLQCLGTY